MSKKKQSRQRATLVYPKHAFQPEDLLRFVELRPFSDGWKELKLTDEDLMALQILIMSNPEGAPVVKGTGGLRKVRFSSSHWQMGKSGGARIGYVYLREHGVVLLVIAYGKNEKDDLTPAEKKEIKLLLRQIEHEFDSGVIK